MMKHLIYSPQIKAIIQRENLNRKLIQLSQKKPKYQIKYCKICGKEYCKSLQNK